MAPVALVMAAALAVPDLDLSAGLEWQAGDYGLGETTTATFAPVNLSADFGAWALGLSTAWARIDGPADVALLDPSALRRRGQAGADEPRSGFTDVAISAEYRPPPAAAAWWALIGGATLPTGDGEKGLSSGSMDVFVIGEAGYDAEPFAVALSVGYRITGEPGWKDPFSLAFSLRRRLGADALAGVTMDYTQPLADGFGPQATVSLFAGRAFGPRLQADVRVWKGLSRESGDFGGGLTLRHALGAAAP
ncbi:MAG: transporter [Phenylobacterium sp.]|uniref:transporter n=1 Tax=Phenylobacterium sp. TaxID=1871053 RepID=UPI001A58671D|nr:transporter [Phenylobacterium sp.]MBL8770150.1 transporter [Phenylobacterium sp.]